MKMNQASHRTRRYRLFLLSETRHQDVTNTPAPSPRIWRCRHEGSGWILWVGSHSALEVSHGPRWREAARQEGKRRRKMRNNGNSSVRHCFFVKKPCHPTPQKQIAGMAFSVFFLTASQTPNSVIYLHFWKSSLIQCALPLQHASTAPRLCHAHLCHNGHNTGRQTGKLKGCCAVKPLRCLSFACFKIKHLFANAFATMDFGTM